MPPLAIELAAARVDALGAAQLLDRIDDRFALLADGDRLAEERQRSLAGAVRWSYQLLDDRERRVFRAVSAFPGPFTLDGAEAVAGPEAGRAVLRLVDCSLLLPPQAGPDGRSRYAMLETLRAFGAGLLTAAAEHADPGSDDWCTARLLLGEVTGTEDPPAMLAHFSAVLDALEDPLRPATPGGFVLLSLCLGARSMALLRLGRVAEAVEDGRRGLDLAVSIGSGGLEAMALSSLSLAIWNGGDSDGALALARRAQQIADDYSGSLQRGLGLIVTGVLIEAGDLAAAEQACAAALASCREVGDQGNLCGVLWHLTILGLRTGRTDEAAAHLRELLQIATQTGVAPLVHTGLDCCGHLCAATGRPAEAVTAWAAMSTLAGPWPLLRGGLNPARRNELQRQARELLGPARAWAAQERGAAMSLATATEYALLLAAEPEPEPPAANGAQAAGLRPAPDGAAEPGAAPDGALRLARLSPRERELVTLVAQGRTDAQIAAQLYITVRTVGSHLDRIRDKTGCRRRADLTRLALSAGLV